MYIVAINFFGPSPSGGPEAGAGEDFPYNEIASAGGKPLAVAENIHIKIRSKYHRCGGNRARKWPPSRFIDSAHHHAE